MERRTARRRWLGTAVVLLSAACAPTGGPAPVDAGVTDAGGFVRDACKSSLLDVATLQVGTGQAAFQDLADNADVAWEAGPQGGHHVWVSLRMRGVRRSGSIVTLSAQDAENPTAPIDLSRRRVVFDLRPEDGGTCALPGLRMQLDELPGIRITDVADHHVILAAAVEDPDGARASASRIVVVRAPGPDAGSP